MIYSNLPVYGTGNTYIENELPQNDTPGNLFSRDNSKIIHPRNGEIKLPANTCRFNPESEGIVRFQDGVIIAYGIGLDLTLDIPDEGKNGWKGSEFTMESIDLNMKDLPVTLSFRNTKNDVLFSCSYEVFSCGTANSNLWISPESILKGAILTGQLSNTSSGYLLLGNPVKSWLSSAGSSLLNSLKTGEFEFITQEVLLGNELILRVRYRLDS